jgi:hypothetical protein
LVLLAQMHVYPHRFAGATCALSTLCGRCFCLFPLSFMSCAVLTMLPIVTLQLPDRFHLPCRCILLHSFIFESPSNFESPWFRRCFAACVHSWPRWTTPGPPRLFRLPAPKARTSTCSSSSSSSLPPLHLNSFPLIFLLQSLQRRVRTAHLKTQHLDTQQDLYSSLSLFCPDDHVSNKGKSR